MTAAPARLRYQRGLWAERAAALWLQCKGYRILARRCRTPFGEVDLIAARHKTLILVEVKYRAKTADALGSISTRQQQRLQRAANYIMPRWPHYQNLRWDIIALAPRSWPRHIINAWEAPL